MQLLSIVIPYKLSQTDELIYALRSLRSFRHKDVWIIGDKPDGINLEKINHISFNQTLDIAQNTIDILRIACNTEEITDDFIWWHDDMYCMKKTVDLPIYHRGSYDDLIQNYKFRMSNYYVRRIRNTNAYLKSIGIKNPLCYETHIPFKLNKKKWLDLNLDGRFNKLSVYGNVYNVGGTKLLRDVKVRTRDRIPSGTFASSHDSTFGSNSLGDKIRELFPDRSEYEQG